jgi:hypothetical protein
MVRRISSPSTATALSFDSSASYAGVARYADASMAAAAGRRSLEAAQGLLRELQIRLESSTR